MEATVTLTGNVGTDITHRATENYGSHASFRLGVTPRIRRDGDWTDAPTTWLRVSCWRALADHARASLAKGDPVIVAGRMRTERWTDDNGADREQLVVEASLIGHDLNRGTAHFTRAARAADEAPQLETRSEAAAAEDAAARATAAALESELDDEPVSVGDRVG